MNFQTPFQVTSGLALTLVLGLPSSAQQTVPIERCWDRESGTGTESWSADTVSLGSSGTEVFTSVGPIIDYTRVWHRFDPQDPPSPVFTDTSSAWTYNHAVSSADHANAHAVIYQVPSATFPRRRVVVGFYTGQGREWLYTFPGETNSSAPHYVGINSDGTKLLAAAYSYYSDQFDVKLFDLESTSSSFPQPSAQFTIADDPEEFVFAPDLEKACFVGPFSSTIYDLSSWSGNTTPPSTIVNHFFGDIDSGGYAVSDQWYVVGTREKIRIYRRVGSSYTQVKEHPTLGLQNSQGIVEISGDESTLVAATNWFANARMNVLAFDLESLTASSSPSMSRVITAAGSYAASVQDLSLAYDGSRFAVALTGDQLNTHDELQVFRPDQDTPIASFDTTGSLFGVDMSADGRAVATAGKNAHAADFNPTTASFALYEVGRWDMRLSGLPRVGEDLTITFRAREDVNFSVIYGPHTPGQTPQVLGGLDGLLYVDLPTARLFQAPLPGPDNLTTVTIELSAGSQGVPTTDAQGLPITASSLVGQTIAFQGISWDTRSLTRDWAAVTVLP